jgi:hypothetical protein
MRDKTESLGIEKSDEEHRIRFYKESLQSPISFVGKAGTVPYKWRQQLLAAYIFTVVPAL